MLVMISLHSGVAVYGDLCGHVRSGGDKLPLRRDFNLAEIVPFPS